MHPRASGAAPPTFRVAPAIAGGLSKVVMDWGDIIALMDAGDAEALRARRAVMLKQTLFKPMH